MLLVSCDKPAPTSGDRGGDDTAPAVTKTVRPPRQAPPDRMEEFESALDQALRLPTVDERNRSIAGLVWNHADTDARLALNAFERLSPDAPERTRLIQHFAMRFAEQDIDQAIRWAESLADPEEISVAYGRISLVLADTDPSRAANLISESGMAGREFDVAVVQVIQRWAKSSPADAAAWVVLFDPSSARTAGIHSVVSHWARQDPAATVNWIASLEQEDLRKHAEYGMAAAILEQSPEIQNEWLQIAGPEVEAEFETLKAAAARAAGD